MLSCSIWFSAPSFWMGAVHHPHSTHDLRSDSQEHHPSCVLASQLHTTTATTTSAETPYAAVHTLVLLMMDIMMPETC